MEEEPRPIKCAFCGKRYVRQQAWKDSFKKKHCTLCEAFIRFAIGIEKSLEEQLEEIIGIRDKKVKIEIRKLSPEESLFETAGIKKTGMRKYE